MMGSRYGHTWQSQHGNIPEGFAAAEWGGTLAGLSRDQIRYGMDQDRIRAGKWPPSSTEFAAMCRPPERVPEWKSIKRDGKYTPEVASAEAAKCNAILGIRPEKAP